jgi:hypothetical protein
MNRVCGYRSCVGLALLALPACVSYPRATDAHDPTNPYSLATQSHSVAANPTTVSTTVKPAIDAPAVVADALDAPPPTPWTPPNASSPSVQMAVHLQPVEPSAQPTAPVSQTAPNLEPRPAPPSFELIIPDRPSPIVGLALKISDGSLLRADPQDIAAAIEQFNAVLLPLRARAALEIPKLCFCRPIAAPALFGLYERLDENHRFRPGEMVAVYMELRNFSCTPKTGDFATHVVSTVEIHNDKGEIVFRFDSDRADSSLSPRQDYCHVGRFTLPALPAGAYTLWLKATDVPTGRTARRSLDFRLASSKG